MDEGEAQQPTTHPTSKHPYGVPPWFVPRVAQVTDYWMEALNAFQRASVTIDQPLFKGETAIPPELAVQWRSVLLGHALVALCSTLEALVRDTLVDWLISSPMAWHGKRVVELKIPVGDWMEKDITTQAQWVLAELWKSSGDPDRDPVARFEALFDLLNIPKAENRFSPELRPDDRDHDETHRRITELWAMRNVIVHHLGVVDAAFRAACPHLPFIEGQVFAISPQEFGRYSYAANAYLMQLLHRLATGYDQTAPPMPTDGRHAA